MAHPNLCRLIGRDKSRPYVILAPYVVGSMRRWPPVTHVWLLAWLRGRKEKLTRIIGLNKSPTESRLPSWGGGWLLVALTRGIEGSSYPFKVVLRQWIPLFRRFFEPFQCLFDISRGTLS